MAVVTAIPLRPTLGLYRINMRINRRFWVMNAFNGLVLPLVVQFAFGQRMGEEGRTRLLIGNLLLGLLLLTLRKTTLNLTFDRVFGARRLLGTTGVTGGSYLASQSLDALTLAVIPLGFAAAAVALGAASPPAGWSWLAPYALSVVVFLALAAWLGSGEGGMPSIALQVNLLTMIAVAFCPLTYPAERVPSLIAPIVLALPPSLAAESLATGWAGVRLQPIPLLGLAAWTVLFSFLLARRYRWHAP